MGTFILLIIAAGLGFWAGMKFGGVRALVRLGQAELGERRRRSRT